MNYSWALALAAASSMLISLAAFAQLVATPSYDLSWNTVDGGGGTMSGGGFAMTATVGQPDAGVLSGGVFLLSGGFLPGVEAVCDADVAVPHNSAVDIDDLVIVITSWGWTGAPGTNLADVTRDGMVNIDDLVQVITHWGACS